MRIHELKLRNFKKFEHYELTLNPSFNLLVGENGAGKTSVLDALAVSLGIWLVSPPDSQLKSSRREIEKSEIRLEPLRTGDRQLFREASGGVEVEASGEILGQSVTWVRRLAASGKIDRNSELVAHSIIQNAFKESVTKHEIVFPVIAYYGAGRTWIAHRERYKSAGGGSPGPARRWAAFYDCLNDRIRITDLTDWFQREAIASLNEGRYRPGFEVVRHAILGCVPGADNIRYDGDRNAIVLSIDGAEQPFNNLSAGQRTVMAMVADIAIKAVTQNNFLVMKASLTQSSAARILELTPGVVLIDELDVHLHPRWQRRIVADLKRTFPQIQLICSSHSPQIIGEVPPEEIRVIGTSETANIPAQSLGLDSNAILESLMDASTRNEEVQTLIDKIESAIQSEDYSLARKQLSELQKIQRGSSRDSSRLEATIETLEVMASA